MRIATWSLSSVVILSCFLFLFALPPAQAYIDAGTGSYLLQLGLGALMAGLFVLITYLRRIRKAIARIFHKTQDEPDD
jgi:hydrogenase-4 membrane subunit HyfE